MLYSRRFSASFSQLRLDHRRVKNSRNPELVNTWESHTYDWPAKDNPPELVILATSDEGLEEGEEDEEEEEGEEGEGEEQEEVLLYSMHWKYASQNKSLQ